MLNYPHDQQPARNAAFERIAGPPRPIEPGAIAVAHAIAPAPFTNPPDYRRISPGPPEYAGPPGYNRYDQSAALAPLLGPPPGYGNRIRLPPLRNPAFERIPSNVYVPRGIHARPSAPAPAPGPVIAPGPIIAPHPVIAPRPAAAPAPRPTGDERDIEPTAPDSTDSEAKLYNILVTFEWTDLVQPRSGSRGRPSKEVKAMDTKLINLALDGITRPLLIRALYRAHRMDRDFLISNIRGPQVKVQWKGKGSGAGKNYSCTVDDNDEWKRVRALILEMDPANTPVSISFHADDVRRFRMQPRVRDEPDEGFDEVGRISRMDVPIETPDIQVLQGRTLQDLEKRWSCEHHPGEHDEFGHCYITTEGEHIDLNMRRKKIWVAGIHAGRASLDVPPNIPEFRADGDPSIGALRIGAPSTSRSRRATNNSAASNNDVGTIVSSIMGPLTAGLVGAISASMGRVPNVSMTPGAPATAPVPAPGPAGPSIRTPPPIPNATPRDLISASITAFREHTGMDISGQQDYLVQHELTPDLMSDVPFDNLANNLGVPGGHAIRYQKFCAEWAKKYNAASHN